MPIVLRWQSSVWRKAGKSALLNAGVEQEILPSATGTLHIYPALKFGRRKPSKTNSFYSYLTPKKKSASANTGVVDVLKEILGDRERKEIQEDF